MAPALHGQPSPLVVGEQNAFTTELLLQHLVLCAEVLDRLLLLPVDPTCQDREQQLLGLQDESHGRLAGGSE